MKAFSKIEAANSTLHLLTSKAKHAQPTTIYHYAVTPISKRAHGRSSGYLKPQKLTLRPALISS